MAGQVFDVIFQPPQHAQTESRKENGGDSRGSWYKIIVNVLRTKYPSTDTDNSAETQSQQGQGQGLICFQAGIVWTQAVSCLIALILQLVHTDRHDQEDSSSASWWEIASLLTLFVSNPVLMSVADGIIVLHTLVTSKKLCDNDLSIT